MHTTEHKDFLTRLAKGISTLFGTQCEVTVHDLTKGFENTIIAIENGHVTKRRIGDGASEMVLQAMKDSSAPAQDNYSYLANTKEGRVVKSASIFLKDENGYPVGLFGINYDITDLLMAQHTLDATLSVQKTAEEKEKKVGFISTTVVELLDRLIEEADTFVAKPVAMMTKEDKTRAIQFLNDKGAFLIKKSGDKVAKHYDISKYTLYNYLDLASPG